MLKPMGKKHVPHPHSRLDEWRSPTHSFKSSILLPAPLRPLLVHTGATLRLQLRYQKYQDKVRALLKKANANEPHEQRGTTGRRRRLKTSSIALAVAIQTVKDEKEENKGTTSLCFQSEGSVGEPWSSSMKLENEWNVMMSMDERLGCFKTTESQEEASDPVAETTSEAFFGLKRDVGSQNVDERPRQLVNIMEPAWLVASIEQRCAATTQVRARPSMRISSPSFVRQFLDVRMAGRDLVFIARSGVGVNLHSQAPAPPDMHLRTLRRRLHEAQSDALHHLSALDPTQVTRVFQSLQSDMWMPAVRCLGWLLTKLWRLLFAGLYVDLASLHHARRVLEAAQGDVSVVFAPTHKSHLDYLIISYLCFAYGIPLPRIAAGNNLDLPLIGSFLRANGSFFIRRSFRDDDVYKQVLEHYVHVLLDDGNPLEVFLEGGRSRHGRVGKPRLGFLSMLLNYVKKTQRSEGLVNNRKKTVLLVPLSLDYDKVYEVDGYVNQLLGKPKEKESLAGFLRSVWDLLSVRLGHAYVRFGEPVSLTATSSLPDASTLVAERMQTSGTITSTAIVAALLMWKRAYVTEAMLATRSTWLLQELEQRAAAVMHMAPTDLIPHALSMLNVQTNSNQVVVSYVQFPVRALELGYYRNHLLHIFLLDMAVFGALDAALREQVESNECVRTVEMGVIQQHARKIWDFLRHICRHPQIDVAASVTRLLARAPGCHWHERAGTVAVDGHVWKTCKLTSFVLSLHWSFSDSLWLTTQGLWYVLDQATDVVTERGFVRCVQMLAKAMLRRAQLVHAEALCRESIQQSLEYLVDTGVVRTEFVPEHASRVVRLCSTSAERVRTLTQEVNLRRKPLTFLWREDQAPRNLTRHEALELMAAARSASSVYATWMTPLTSLDTHDWMPWGLTLGCAFARSGARRAWFPGFCTTSRYKTPVEPVHVPVLLNETVAAFSHAHTDASGHYHFVDGTAGLGGHSRALLEKFPNATVLCIDRDPEVLGICEAKLADFARRVRFHTGSYADMATSLAAAAFPDEVDGILVDLGANSFHFDTPRRGFSVLREGPLDMRFNQSDTARGTAADAVNRLSEVQLTHIFRAYGEETRAKHVAQAIVRARDARGKAFTTTGELRDCIERVAKTWQRPTRWKSGKHHNRRTHAATRCFQALRIYVNDELHHVTNGVNQLTHHLALNGRLVTIAFHSLEDRPIKTLFRQLDQQSQREPDEDHEQGRSHPCRAKRFRLTRRKAIQATAQEIAINARSRSARLRCLARIQ